ncbi:P-loop containing nucleoside triphosphate hydrolase protein [Basidiobolus meristosporus CBS 931.73]|uniref:p-loop containing nucleoside triphosphate hydrolase protein n=1 Tax=Basidiobolus meristosporus CBS 931.73 TaxID=1314790 RepID=A0A1Y1XUD0_9FUNG|nr:P-loop containing nucleoside triphosphate hydrolase protein [Basidiobolus meristosporus CBS 931.73]|eukprot:ORX89323.1 P-loop containing nucleoside triphosphate hydrolase protein [Basidiobolus meristosporus CBS 931.73]
MESNKLPETQNTTSRKLPEKSRVLILVGAPGSGKSTFAKSLCSYDKSWRRVNQDDMGDRSTCERYTRRWLKEGRNAVIDRCNFDEKQRKTWIRIAFEFDLLPEVIFFTTPFQECENRVQAREEHPTGVVGEEGLEVLRRFQRMLTRPTLEEGFYKALEIDTRQAIFVDGYYTNEYILQQLNALSHSPENQHMLNIRTTIIIRVIIEAIHIRVIIEAIHIRIINLDTPLMGEVGIRKGTRNIVQGIMIIMLRKIGGIKHISLPLGQSTRALSQTSLGEIPEGLNNITGPGETTTR